MYVFNLNFNLKFVRKSHFGDVLARLLLALVLVPSPCWPPPLTCVVSIFSSGRVDRNLKVGGSVR